MIDIAIYISFGFFVLTWAAMGLISVGLYHQILQPYETQMVKFLSSSFLAMTTSGCILFLLIIGKNISL